MVRVICKFAAAQRAYFYGRKHTLDLSHTHGFNIIIMAAVVFVLRFIHLQHKSSKTKPMRRLRAGQHKTQR